MIDLSNNNAGADFNTVHKNGVRRVYLKLTEGVGFVDGKHDGFRKAALAAGLKVGEYHFAHPELNLPKAEAEFFCLHLPRLKAGRCLRPCLDLEAGTPEPRVARWANEFVAYVRKHTGHRVVIYSNPSYLTRCGFSERPGPLWIAAYGRDDGKEYPVTIPPPWRHAAAHQFSSQGHVAGVRGLCDVSHVFNPLALDVHGWPLR